MFQFNIHTNIYTCLYIWVTPITVIFFQLDAKELDFAIFGVLKSQTDHAAKYIPVSNVFLTPCQYPVCFTNCSLSYSKLFIISSRGFWTNSVSNLKLCWNCSSGRYFYYLLLKFMQTQINIFFIFYMNILFIFYMKFILVLYWEASSIVWATAVAFKVQ